MATNITGAFSRQSQTASNPPPVVKIKVALGGRELTFEGREADTLKRLIARGEAGLTSIENHGPRISHYVMKIRRAGIAVEMIREPHDGGFPGKHGRYFLRSPLRVLERVNVGEARHAAA
jgi:hypothetical protein